MKKTSIYFVVLFLSFLFTGMGAFAQGNTCNTATPFCTTAQDPGFTWPNTSNGSTAQSGPSYGCLGSEPNPSWFYMETTASGAMTFTLSQVDNGGTGIDVDFVAWGPFTAAQFATACNNLTGSCTGGSGNLTANPGCSGGIVDCSYSTAATENFTLNSPGPNMFYIVMITNYDGSAGYITLSQTGGPYTNCAVTCPTSLPLAAEDNATSAAIANGTTLSCTQGLFWIYANEPNNGSVGNVYTDIFTPCIDVDFKYYQTNLGTNETVNLYEGGVYSNCIGPSGSCAFPIGGSPPATVGNYWDLLWNYLDPTKAHDFGFCHSGSVTTTTVTIEDCWKNTPLVPSFTIGTGSPSCFTVTVPANTGIGTASFSISPGSGASSITDYKDGYVLINPATLAAGTYTVTYYFTGTNCPQATGTFVFTVPVKPVVSITSTNPVTICNGQSTTLSASATGGTISSYTWTNSAGLSATTGTSVTASPTTTTVYTVNATNTAGCSAATPATVTVNVTPLPTLTVTSASICSGNSVVLTATGATTYTWSANAGSVTTSTASVTPPTGTTVYTVTGTQSNCSKAYTTTVTVTATPTLTVSGTKSICSGQSTTLSGATASSYSWSVGSTSANISVNPSSTTTYTLTGNNGTCSSSVAVTVTVTPTPTLSITGTTALCSGQSTTLTGATATAYTWNPGGITTNTISVSPGVGTTNYTLTGSNGGSCTSTKTVAVVVTATPTVAISGTTNLCGGQSSTLTGATASTYTWSTGATTNTISVTPPVGSTTYTLTGANGACTASTTVTMSVTASPTLTISGTTALCSGQSTTLTGATATAYTWSPGGATTSTISVSPPTGTTNYTLTGSNGGSCTATKTVAIVVTATPTLTISGTTNLCSGQTKVLTGATASTYTWSTGATTNTISVTPPTGTTTYTLNGSNGACTSSTTVTMSVTPTPTISITGNTAICSGQSTTLTGGTANTYTWNPGGITTSTITVAPPTGSTNYTLTGSNGGGCNTTSVVTVNVTATPTVAITGNINICSGSSTVLTGASAASYSWSPGGATTNTITVTPPVGATTYTLQGFNGVCTASTVATVSVTATPTVTITGNNNICSGQSEVLTGATATNYTWSPGGTTGSTVTVNPGTTSTYTLTGANGTCTASAIASVSVTPTPTVNISGAAAVCDGQTLVLTGATATSYSWSSGGITTNTLSVTPPVGTTSYTLTGANGVCTASAVASVTVNPLPQITGSVVTAAPCGQSTGCITSVTVGNGVPTYSYSWNGGSTYSTSSSTCSIPAGSYPVQVMDANGCTTNGSISVPSQNGPTAPTAAATATAVCAGDSAIFTVSPTTSGITYTWTDITGGGTYVGPSYTVQNIPSGTYAVSVQASDVNGCLSSSTNLTVTVNSLPPTSVSGTAHFCKGSSTTLNASPGGSGYSYQWSQGGTNIGGATSATYTTSAAGNYGVVITDNATGCSAPSSGNYTVTIDSLPKIDTTSMVISNSNCGGSTGSVMNVTVTPGSGNSYSWSNSSGTVVGTSINLSNVPAGSYCLLVTTSPATNCKDSICGVTVNNAGAPPTPTLTTSNNTYCAGQTQSAITVGGSGTFSWYSDPGLTTQIATGPTYTPNVIATTTFYVTATSSGCQSTSLPVTVTINPNPTAPVLSGSATNPLTECQNSTPGSLSVATTGTVTSVPVWYNGSTYVTSGTSYTPGTSTPGTTVYTIIDSASVTGCKDTSASNVLTVTVTINPLPTGPTLGAGVSNPLVECEGDTPPQSITVATTGTVTSVPVWYNGSTYVTSGNSYTPPTTPAGTTVYTIADSATTGGCVNLSVGNVITVTVTINPLPTGPTLSGSATNPLSECEGSSAQSINVATSGTVTSVPVWYTSTGTYVTSGNSYTPPTTPPGTTIYTIVDSATVGGCKNLNAGNVITVTVTINPTPSVTGTPSYTTSACGNLNGGIGGLTATGGTPGYTYQWTDSTGAVVGTSATLSGMGTGSYSLVVTDTLGCKSTGSTNSFTVSGSTAINATFTPSATSGQAPLAVTFANGSTGAAGYNWTFTGLAGDTSSATNPSFTYNNAGTYTVVLIASNGACKDTAYSVITIDQATSIIIPNIFSPNGDGVNDEFIIMCTGMDKLHCDIFNRWGQLVYTLTAPNQNWDGKLNNGNMATEGTYYYMLNATGFDKKTYTYQGPLTLVK
ncbi:MAG: Ig-like domain-containing protein [Bacteroidia bacterium]